MHEVSRSGAMIPFLKWAGGKRWLAQKHADLLDIPKGARYVEPFVGSGAIFFALRPKAALLNDANAQLIETYETIRLDWRMVVDKLKKHHRSHCQDYYYEVRSSRPNSATGRAARFIYLNRTCFNGIYRVNRNGEFNVPKGTKTEVLLSTDDFAGVAEALENVEFCSEDFESVLKRVGRGDFIFADPPYTVKHNLNGFIKYNEQLFSWGDQERLKDLLFAAAARGADVVLTNADHPSIHELYSGCDIKRLERYSVMASKSHLRRKTTEVIISI